MSAFMVVTQRDATFCMAATFVGNANLVTHSEVFLKSGPRYKIAGRADQVVLDVCFLHAVR